MLTDDARHPRKCTARSSRTKQLCERWAMKAQTVCMMHGGKAPQAMVKEAVMEVADMRLRGLTPLAVDVLERLLRADSEAVVLGAAKDVLDRAGLKATHRIEVDTEITVKRPW